MESAPAEGDDLSVWAVLERVADVWDAVRGRASQAALRLWDQASAWLGLKHPRPSPIRWVDRSACEPVCPPKFVGRADPITGETISAYDHVYVCRYCDAAYLAANWHEVAGRNGGACLVCAKRGGVKD